MEIRTIGIIGQGALGVMYGNHLTKKLGNGHVFFIADETRVERYRKTGMSCNGEKCGFTYRSPAEAVTAISSLCRQIYGNGECDPDREAVCRGEYPVLVGAHGISSEGMIEEVYGADHVLYACVQGMDAGKDGSAVTYKNMGYITIGNKDKSRDEKLKAVTDLFDRTGLSYQVPDDILREQWNKLMLNTGVNQVTAVYGAPYSLIQKEGEARTMMIEAMREVLRVADTQDVDLSEADISYWLDLLATLNPDGHTSMCQDVLAGRPTEVELFAGTMLKIAEEEGLSLPVNAFLYERLKELETAED